MSRYHETELLIAEVKKRPTIWDAASESYKNRETRADEWIEIARCCHPGFAKESEDERKQIVKDLQTRWKSLRDSYSKDLRKSRRQGNLMTPASRSKRYVFSDQMSFLQGVVAMKETTINGSRGQGYDHTSYHYAGLSANGGAEAGENKRRHEDDDDDDDRDVKLGISLECEASPPEEYSISLNADYFQAGSPERLGILSSPEKKRRRGLPAAEELMLRLVEREEEDRDPDRAFFNSLLPAVREFSLAQKLEFRTEVLLLMRKMKPGGGGGFATGVDEGRGQAKA